MMNQIQNNFSLKIKKVENLETIQVQKYNKNVWNCKIDNDYYMIVRRQFNNKDNILNNQIINLQEAVCQIGDIKKGKNNLNLELEYGDKDSIIVDMHGIDNFRFAKELVFNDSDVRKMIIRLGLLDKNTKYFRFGCSGARECNFHPGGEVLEKSLINGNDGSGLSQSISGYLPKNDEYSKKISLYDESKEYLREERIVYSHTAFLKKCDIENSKCLYIKVKPTKNNTSLLDIIYELANKLDLYSYAIQMCIQTDNNDSYTDIKGRVLKHMPKEAFKELQEATDIAIEKVFRLEKNNIMYGVGTNYLRYEPEWKEFTGGRQYEKRGHIHATVLGETKAKRHEVFHLRDVFVSPSSDIQLVLTPINNVYKIYPIYLNNGKFYCKTTDKSVDSVIREIQRLDESKCV